MQNRFGTKRNKGRMYNRDFGSSREAGGRTWGSGMGRATANRGQWLSKLLGNVLGKAMYTKLHRKGL
jgi:hypothetical protein